MVSTRKTILGRVLPLLVAFLLFPSAQAAPLSPSAPAIDIQTLQKKPFLLAVEDVFEISGMGVVATGTVERGMVKLEEMVDLVGLRPAVGKAKIRAIEKSRQQMSEAGPGDYIGVFLRGVTKAEVERGMVLSKPDALKAMKSFEATIRLFTKEEGGRSTPIFNDYRPQFSFRTATVSGTVKLPKNIESTKPGDRLTVHMELEQTVALEKGQRFVIREGGRSVGEGVVLKF